jgi:DnaK suppressor protein
MTEHKKKLEEEKATLLGQLSGLGLRNEANNEWEAKPETTDIETADSNNSADRFEDFEEKTALIVPLEARLKEVEAALARIENKTYGKCRVCGNPIEEARLHANPAAETCMKHLEA